MDQGEGHNLLYRYYFDKDSRRCRELTYLGLRGNANNFLNMDDCEATCLGKYQILESHSGSSSEPEVVSPKPNIADIFALRYPYV